MNFWRGEYRRKHPLFNESSFRFILHEYVGPRRSSAGRVTDACLPLCDGGVGFEVSFVVGQGGLSGFKGQSSCTVSYEQS